MSLSDMLDSANGRKKILIVDDDADFADSLRKALASWLPDYDFEVCINDPSDTTIPAPWENICHQHPLLAGIISDTGMPGMNGIQLCKQTRKNYPGIPFVLMSGNFKPFANDLRALPSELQPSCLMDKKDIVIREKIELLALNIFTPAAVTA